MLDKKLPVLIASDVPLGWVMGRLATCESYTDRE
jgi:hypothetical protein